ncbi:hypothetical protein ACFL02_09570, partial [Planctomycetota bacterium]
MVKISKWAIVDPSAQIGPDVIVGPFCEVGPEVTIETGCELMNHVTILGKTRIGIDQHKPNL